ncbi:hypothetical protein L6V77_22010 [Myxococcota bacterium]|nr:hypothetical protein [Myxococcota bacterium]
MREHLRFTGMLLLAGAGTGLIASMFWGPGLISWWWTPPGQAGSITNLCGDQVREAAGALVRMQVITGIGLGIVFAGVGHFVAYKRRQAAAAPAPPPAAPPA